MRRYLKGDALIVPFWLITSCFRFNLIRSVWSGVPGYNDHSEGRPYDIQHWAATSKGFAVLFENLVDIVVMRDWEGI